MTENNIYDIKRQYSMIQALNVIQQPTNPSWIKEKKGGLSYVSGDVVTRVLNKAFNYQWSFRVLETRVVDSSDKRDRNGNVTEQNPVVQTLGSLEVPGLGVRQQWGSQPIIGGSDVQEHAFKSATTDALKKCASLFGVVLDLYGQDGMQQLSTTARDFLFDDEVYFEKLKENIRSKKEQEKQQVEEHIEKPAPEPKAEPVEEPQREVPTEQPVAEEMPASQPEPAKEERPKEEQPKGLYDFDAEDLEKLKTERIRLGLTDANLLNEAVRTYFNNPEMTANHLTNSTIKDFLIYLSHK